LKEITNTGKSIAESYSNIGSLNSIGLILVEHNKNIREILNRIYKITIPRSSEYVVSESEKAGLKFAEFKDVEGVATRLMQDWLFTYGLQHAESITTTTKDIAAAIVADGIAEGVGQEYIGRSIFDKIGQRNSLTMARSKLIARTESHMSSQNAIFNIAGSIDSNGTMFKEWVSANQPDRTRKTHLKANGTNIRREEYFKVGKASLLHPADQNSGHPEETINCRCVLVFSNTA